MLCTNSQLLIVAFSVNLFPVVTKIVLPLSKWQQQQMLPTLLPLTVMPLSLPHPYCLHLFSIKLSLQLLSSLFLLSLYWLMLWLLVSCCDACCLVLSCLPKPVALATTIALQWDNNRNKMATAKHAYNQAALLKQQRCWQQPLLHSSLSIAALTKEKCNKQLAAKKRVVTETVLDLKHNATSLTSYIFIMVVMRLVVEATAKRGMRLVVKAMTKERSSHWDKGPMQLSLQMPSFSSILQPWMLHQ